MRLRLTAFGLTVFHTLVPHLRLGMRPKMILNLSENSCLKL